MDEKKYPRAFLGAVVLVVISLALASLIDSYMAFRFRYLMLWGLGTLLLPLLLLIRQSRRTKLSFSAMVMASFLVLYLIPWNTRKPFLLDFYRIQPGMTQVEVEEIMEGYIRGTGMPRPDGYPGEFQIPDSIIFRHAKRGNYNADWGVVHLADGLVVKAEFLPD